MNLTEFVKQNNIEGVPTKALVNILRSGNPRYLIKYPEPGSIVILDTITLWAKIISCVSKYYKHAVNNKYQRMAKSNPHAFCMAIRKAFCVDISMSPSMCTSCHAEVFKNSFDDINLTRK